MRGCGEANELLFGSLAGLDMAATTSLTGSDKDALDASAGTASASTTPETGADVSDNSSAGPLLLPWPWVLDDLSTVSSSKSSAATDSAASGGLCLFKKPLWASLSFDFLTGGSRFWAETPPRGLERLGERLGDEGVEAETPSPGMERLVFRVEGAITKLSR